MYWYSKVLKHYVDFKGRASRKEYWNFTLFNLIFIIVLFYLDYFMGNFGYRIGGLTFGNFSGIYILAVLIPWVAVGVRRLHDIGKACWWLFPFIVLFIYNMIIPNEILEELGYFFVFYSILSMIWIPYLAFLIVLMVLKSQSGVNKYGAKPADINEKNKHIYDDYIILLNRYDKLSKKYTRENKYLLNDNNVFDEDKLEKMGEYLENRKLELESLKCKIEDLEKQIHNTIEIDTDMLNK